MNGHRLPFAARDRSENRSPERRSRILPPFATPSELPFLGRADKRPTRFELSFRRLSPVCQLLPVSCRPGRI